MDILFFLSLFIHHISADPNSCKFFYADNPIAAEDEAFFPVILDTCYWTSPGESYGYYCVDQYNGVDLGETMVVQYQFPGPNCPDGPSNPDAFNYTGPYPCNPPNCHCDGVAEMCSVATQIGCNTTNVIEETYVIDVCIGFDNENVGGYNVKCDPDGANLGVYKEWYDSIDCSGSLRNTPAPTYTPAPTFFAECRSTTCPETASSENSVNGGVIAAVVILCICLIGCVVVGLVYYLRRRKHDQYFDSTEDDARL